MLRRRGGRIDPRQLALSEVQRPMAFMRYFLRWPDCPYDLEISNVLIAEAGAFR